MFLPFRVESDQDCEYQQPWPVAVWILLLSLLAVHLYVYVGLEAEADRYDVFYRFGVVRYRLYWWSLITHAFLHGGWMHLLANAYCLWIYGSHLERMLGTARFLVLYLVGAVISILVHLLTISPFFVDVPTIGASGAISAVMGAFFVIMPMARLDCLFFSIISFRPLVVRLPACVILGMWFLGQLLYSLQLVVGVEGIAFWAHVAGFATGAAAGTLFYRIKHKRIKEAELEKKRLEYCTMRCEYL